MSKKKLTKKKKKQLLALFATTSMTVNMMVMPVAVLANNSSNSTDMEKNGELILGENEISKDVLPDNFNLDEKSEQTDLIAEDNNENSSEATNGLEEVDTSDINIEKNQINFSSGSYDDAGFWNFNQGVLTLNGGTLSAATGENSWLKYIAKTEVQDIRVIDAAGAADLSRLFNDYTNVKKITFDRFDTSRTTTMAHMFSGCTNLISVDLSSFDTSQVIDMSYMFNACSSLIEINVSNFDTSKVTTMKSMFGNCRNLTKLDLSSFNTARVTTMENMFYECNKLVELDLSEFDTSRTPTMYWMFSRCDSLERLRLGRQTKLSTTARLRSPSNVEFWYDASGKKVLNTSNELIQYHDKENKTTTYTIGNSVYEDNGVWRFQDGLLTLTNGTLYSKPGVTGVTTTGTNTWLRFLNIDDIQEIRVVNAIGGSNLSSFFSSYTKVEKITFDNFDTSQTSILSSMFSNCSSLKTLDLSDFDTSNVYMMANMFSGCTNLIFLDLSSFDTGKLYSGSGTNSMFSGCDSLEKLNLGSLMTLAVNMNLKTLADLEFWYGKLEDNYLDTSADLIAYHNNLKETNTYTLINRSEKIVTLTFDTMDGSEIATIETNFGNVWLEPEAPTKEGHNFMGWYTDSEYTEEFDFSKPATKSMTVYAKWAEEKEETIFEVDDYYIGGYNITGRFSAPIITAQLRINGSISNKGGTFNSNDGTFYYYAGAGRIQTGQEVVLEGLDKAGNIVETVNIEPKVVEGALSDVQHTVGSSTITGTYMGDMSKARLVVNGNIISVGGTFKDGIFSYYVAPNQVIESDTVYLQGYDKEGDPVGDLTPVTLQKQQGHLTEANYKLGQSTITGTYEGNVKKARLLVDGKQISWGGTFKDGTFSYYVAPGTIKEGSMVTMDSYGEGDILLAENFSVLIQS
ncbi:BspA family leucine-rich repeat surface protein [Enterococcus faecalis]|uniref:BspA family leucine-rich repeat surface protein n=1 Tax=Enterococcus faecalis TaxID=1351 RepID=UPI002DBFEC0B|nr:BspA family leucine-rich repeat surface protein [Enterococcus faecalis]MEB7428083.1 BspA family leucine-rich repeat surface protein [Enterococcus faecalis]